MKTDFSNTSDAIQALYTDTARNTERYIQLSEKFSHINYSKGKPFYFSAPGRIEICGNHTDHQGGKVIASAIETDAAAIAAKNNSDLIRIDSLGQRPFSINIEDTELKRFEIGKSVGLVRGILSGFQKKGIQLCGIDICIASDVVTGSGISSSAAFEMLIAKALDFFCTGGAHSPLELAKIGQDAEMNYFGKPCGLMDQAASACGGCIKIDFGRDEPEISPVMPDCITKRFDIFIVHTGGSHAKLGREYASIVDEMKAAARVFGKDRLSLVNEDEFLAEINTVREMAGDRAALRSMHFFSENRRVELAYNALMQNDADGFLDCINESGESSELLLQNVYVDYVQNKSVALALGLTKKFIKDNHIRAAVRIHGGGFLGTILAFISKERSADYKAYMEGVFGEGAVQTANIRQYGSTVTEY